MLTRSFLQSYLLVEKYENIQCQLDGLDIINKQDVIKTKEPTREEKERIQKRIVKVKSQSNVSFYDFINDIFTRENIEKKYWKKFIQSLPESYKDDFDEDGIVEFINDNKKYYCR